jgi:hypothetical protein
MAIIHKELANDLLPLTSKQKEETGNTLVRMLGGDPTKIANKLPPRRGNSDGGIDGRIPIEIILNVAISREMNQHLIPYKTEKRKGTTMAAFCVKLEKKPFNRTELGSFIFDMEREDIRDGIIISVKPLSQDAKAEYERINLSGSFNLFHLLVEDILAGEVNVPFDFVNNKSLKKDLIQFLQQNCQ